MKAKPDVSQFIDGGNERAVDRGQPPAEPKPEPVSARAARAPATPVANAEVPLQLVALRLPKDLIAAIDDEVYHRGKRLGRRVTKQDLTEEILRAGIKALKIQIA